MGKITLQQDGRDKKTIHVTEDFLIFKAKEFFKWRKNITLQRIYSLGSKQYNDFIEYLYKLNKDQKTNLINI